MATPMSSVNRAIPASLAHIFKFIAVILAGFVANESLAPIMAIGSVSHMDKFLHAAVYFGLTFFVAGGWRHSTLLFVFLVMAAFGAALEVGQGLMNLGRSASFWDQFANMFGAALACCVWIMIVKLYRKAKT